MPTCCPRNPARASQPPERAVHILTQACHSLAEAHQGGLIHRDVKPANIYVCRYGLDWDFVKLLDFGLVKNAQIPVETGRPLTVAGVVAGTPGYMAPEMGLGNPDVDWRVDIYALGCVGYWLLTGKPVFDGEGSPMKIIMDHIQKQPPAVSQRTQEPIPLELDSILLQCLSKDPNERPQTMQDLARELGTVAGAPTTVSDEQAKLQEAQGALRAFFDLFAAKASLALAADPDERARLLALLPRAEERRHLRREPTRASG